MTDAKRRALAQKIGRRGELIFEQWATIGGFSASKLQDDYGVDYVCQQMLPTSKGSEEVTGLSVLVQVRATAIEKSGKPPRIGFSREDVETAMRQAGVFCVAAVHMPTSEVRFRWLDIALLEQWASFLKSERDSISMRLDSMSEGADRFSRELVQASRPSQRAKFMKARTQLRLEEVIPGAVLHTNSGAMGELGSCRGPQPHVHRERDGGQTRGAGHGDVPADPFCARLW
ncbi:protein of unknown function [Variovorax sp. HW608]|uniref:DUF4365 domain-containing protein n=1 Tax=Variovorax sp. HW608 TaxID=1034889 RepID=UPI00081F7D60|nr:DUF4365 domain-containing protein [Variovorax sp. HW608]SCK54657.1 protein of unknown function [Variovorax sp. HW608]